VLAHPPGLYQSWNFGIAQCRAPYVYVSTVGETITRAGLEALFRAAESLRADVVISPPRMVKMSGEAKEKTWPVHGLVEELQLQRPCGLDGEAVELFAVAHLLRGILGSSASNLYRTETLQRFPFRTDFGTAGDHAWGLEHSREIRLAVVPESFSTFLFHPKAYAKSDYAVDDFNEKCLALARAAVEKRRGSGPTPASPAEGLVNGLLSAWKEFLAQKRSVADAKRAALWWLSPSAWGAHRRRARALAEVALFQRQAMLELAARVAHDGRSR
jgi:hypothetical protein